VIITTQ